METTLQGQTKEVNKSDLFSKLSEIDRRNMENLTSEFLTVAKEMGISGNLLVVGGIIDKPLPRKDIDMLAIFEGEGLPKQEDFSDYYSFSLKDFELLETVLRKITEKNPNFSIGEILKPSIDEEFQSPSILKFGGSVKINVKEGTMFEFIRESGRGLKSVTASIQDRPFVIL